jgi:hypothetical protein
MASSSHTLRSILSQQSAVIVVNLNVLFRYKPSFRLLFSFDTSITATVATATVAVIITAVVVIAASAIVISFFRTLCLIDKPILFVRVYASSIIVSILGNTPITVRFISFV